jgi:hypothetical protein
LKDNWFFKGLILGITLQPYLAPRPASGDISFTGLSAWLPDCPALAFWQQLKTFHIELLATLSIYFANIVSEYSCLPLTAPNTFSKYIFLLQNPSMITVITTSTKRLRVSTE